MARAGEDRRDEGTGWRWLPAGAAGWASYLLVFLPGILSIAYVYWYGVNVVYRDQWEMVTLFGTLSADELTFSDLWEPHNEHRFFFPRIAMLALGTVTEWNNLAEMYLIQACLFVTLISLLLAFGKKPGLLFFVPVAFLVFSLRQSQNMLWGYQLTFAFAQTSGVLALFLLHARGRGKLPKIAFSAASLSGTVAAFSAIQGLLVWPAGLLQLLIAPVEKPAKKRLVAAWSLTGAGVWTVYFLGYERDVAPPLPQLLTRPAATAEFFLSAVGTPLFPQQGFVLAGGAMLAGLAAIGAFLIYRGRKPGEYSFWLSLLAFSLLTSLSVTWGRSERGIEAATASKYTTFSLLAVIGVYVILVKLWSDRRTRLTTALLGVSSAVILVSIAASYWNGIHLGAETETSRARAAFVLSTYESQPDEAFETLHRRPENVERRAPILEELGYNVFSEP